MYNLLNNYNSVVLYVQYMVHVLFLASAASVNGKSQTRRQSFEAVDVPIVDTPEPELQPQTIGLEKDMQAAIRQNIGQIEPSLRITDGGRERSVETGFIDITAEDSDGIPVVIELKTGVAGQRAVAQSLSYIGSLMEEEGTDQVRGILIASEFDRKARAAAKVCHKRSLLLRSFKCWLADGQ